MKTRRIGATITSNHNHEKINKIKHQKIAPKCLVHKVKIEAGVGAGVEVLETHHTEDEEIGTGKTDMKGMAVVAVVDVKGMVNEIVDPKKRNRSIAVEVALGHDHLVIDPEM